MLTDERFTVILVGVSYTLTLIFLTTLYKMTKIRTYTIPSATALAFATALGLATAPAQAAAVIQYNGCASTSFCTFTELTGGGSITIDEDGDGKIDKKFDKWARTGSGLLPSDLQISAFGAPLSGGLTFSTATGWNVPPDNLSNQFLFDVTAVNPDIQLTTLTAALITSSSTPFGNPLSPTGTRGIQVNASGAIISDYLGVKTSPATVALPNPITDTINVAITGLLLPSPPFTPAGSAQLKSFSLTFAQSTRVPEPGTVAGLLAVGGLGLAMKRRQQR